MKLKKILLVTCLCLGVVFSLSGCKMLSSASEKIEGKWKVADSYNQKGTIEIKDDTITDLTKKKFKLKVVSKGFVNKIHYVGIKIDDKLYSVVFPKKDNENIAFLIKVDDEDKMVVGKVIYAMNRNELPSYTDYVNKYGY